MRGQIRDNPILVNKYALKVVGLIEITATRIGGLEQELETAVLPDRTRVSGGNTKGGEFEIDVPAHHDAEILAMEGWLRSAQDPVNPLYKLPGTLLLKRSAGGLPRSYTLTGLFPMKRVTPELDMANEGELAVVTYTLSFDDIVPL